MKTMILAAVATLSLGVGAAFAAGGGAGPVGYEAPAYGAQAFSDHSHDRQISFRDSVLGKMLHYNSAESNSRMAAGASPKG